MGLTTGGEFKWRHFRRADPPLRAWYCKYGISYRDIEEMMAESGVAVDHTTLYRWVQHYARALEKRTLWYQNRMRTRQCISLDPNIAGKTCVVTSCSAQLPQG